MEDSADLGVERSRVEEAFAARGLQTSWSLDDRAEQVWALLTVRKVVDRTVLEHLPGLQFVGVVFTGYDHIDLEECARRGISVSNVPGYSTNSCAELAITMVMAMLRQVVSLQDELRAGHWLRSPGEDFAGKCVGIVGTGEIGNRCAELCHAFRVGRLIGWSRTQRSEFLAAGGEYVESLASVFLKCDIVIVCISLNRQTRGLISEALLKLLSPESILVNVARGPVIEKGSLVALLKERRFRAALDVFNEEPLTPDDPLKEVPPECLLMVPHIGHRTSQALDRRFMVALENLLAFRSGHPQNLVQ